MAPASQLRAKLVGVEQGARLERRGRVGAGDGRGIGPRVVEHGVDGVHRRPEGGARGGVGPAGEGGDRQTADARDLARGAQAVGIDGQQAVGAIEVELHLAPGRGVHDGQERPAQSVAGKLFRRADGSGDTHHRDDFRDGRDGIWIGRGWQRGGAAEGEFAAVEFEFAGLPVETGDVGVVEGGAFGGSQRVRAVPNPKGAFGSGRLGGAGGGCQVGQQQRAGSKDGRSRFHDVRKSDAERHPGTAGVPPAKGGSPWTDQIRCGQDARAPGAEAPVAQRERAIIFRSSSCSLWPPFWLNTPRQHPSRSSSVLPQSWRT